MTDYLQNQAVPSRRFYAYVTANQSELASTNNTLTAYVSPFLQRLRADRIKVALKNLNLVISTTTVTTPAVPIAHTGLVILQGKSPTNMFADLSEKAILHSYASNGRGNQVDTVTYNSSADDEVSVSLDKQTDLDDGTLKLQLINMNVFGDAGAVDTLVQVQAILEITEDYLSM